MGALGHPPDGMPFDNWRRTVEHFNSEEHQRRSQVNQQNRQKQKYPNRGGTSSYSNACHKQAQDRLQTFIRAHTRKDGTIDPAALPTIVSFCN